MRGAPWLCFLLCGMGCGGGDDTGGRVPLVNPPATTGSGTGTASIPTGSAYFRGVHLVEDMAGLQLRFAGSTVLSMSRWSSTDMPNAVEVEPGSYLFEALDPATGAILAQVNATLVADDNLSILFIGSATDGTIEAIAKVDNLDPAPDGTHRVTYVHADDDLPPIFIYFGADEPAGTEYGVVSSELFYQASVETRLDFDIDRDGFIDTSCLYIFADLPEFGSSNIYLTSAGMFHHRRGTAFYDLGPVPGANWCP